MTRIVAPCLPTPSPVGSQPTGRTDKRQDQGFQPCFQEVLRSELQTASGVKFSAHAMNRIESRKIDIGRSEAQKVARAVEAAREKGSRESLFIGDRYALIVNVENRTVVTAMDREQMSEAVVTNIDSTVLL